MPKQIIDGHKIKIMHDENSPADKLHKLKKSAYGKSGLTQKELAEIGKAYLEQ